MDLLDLIPGPWRILALVGAFLATFAAGAITMHKIDAGQYLSLKLEYEQAARAAVDTARAIEHRVAKIDDAHAAAEAVAQERIANHTITLTKEITRYVPQRVAVACVPWGVVRLFDASALGLDPTTTGPPPGVSDEACSPVAVVDLTAAIIANHGIARQNAQQLNELEADIRDRTAEFNSGRPRSPSEEAPEPATLP